jgi:hypothetical protein
VQTFKELELEVIGVLTPTLLEVLPVVKDASYDAFQWLLNSQKEAEEEEEEEEEEGGSDGTQVNETRPVDLHTLAALIIEKQAEAAYVSSELKKKKLSMMLRRDFEDKNIHSLTPEDIEVISTFKQEIQRSVGEKEKEFDALFDELRTQADVVEQAYKKIKRTVSRLDDIMYDL